MQKVKFQIYEKNKHMVLKGQIGVIKEKDKMNTTVQFLEYFEETFDVRELGKIE